MQPAPEDNEWITATRRAIGRRIQQERLRQNLTQDQVWLAAHISRYTLQRAEAGAEMKLSTLLRIAHVLEVPLSQLVADDSPNT